MFHFVLCLCKQRRRIFEVVLASKSGGPYATCVSHRGVSKMPPFPPSPPDSENIECKLQSRADCWGGPPAPPGTQSASYALALLAGFLPEATQLTHASGFPQFEVAPGEYLAGVMGFSPAPTLSHKSRNALGIMFSVWGGVGGTGAFY